ncbi:hypothetical protein CPB84DRAFT_1790698 [Gymnopilus junonius]|uniref:DUF6699 domain-containing protein n=1 Tax=Gymnopilus junonius TaxID=109634 RepID=A0A9P5NF10_GYMJU|nr:hypothetical protein CPB84DRAFT_1790698 [Gymnopilus junonius]
MDHTPLTPRVRFSSDDLQDEEEDNHVATPSTPSPSRSGSTVSDVDPLTPPSPSFPVLTESKDSSPISEPPAYPKLHPVLCGLHAAVTWDIAEDPRGLPAFATDAQDPAASHNSCYPIPQLAVMAEALPDWPLHLAAQSDGQYLTVMQVMWEVHQHLLKRVSREHVLSQPRERQQEIYKAYKLRLKCWPQTDEGIIRLDYLPGRTFQGLCVTGPGEGPTQWEARLDVS